MKKLLLMLSMGLVIAGTASAQTTAADNGKKDKKARFEHRGGERTKKSPEERAAKQTEMLTQKLALTEKQQRQVQALNLKHAQQMEDFRTKHAANENSKPQKGDRDDFKNMHASWEKEFKDILNKDQIVKYEASREEMKNRNHARQGEFKGKGKGKRGETNNG